jgi:CBS-domain-containing membrane protein
MLLAWVVLSLRRNRDERRTDHADGKSDDFGPGTIGPRDMMSKAKSFMEAGAFRRLPVLDEGQLVGILTERDLRQYAGYQESTRVNAAMSTRSSPSLRMTRWKTRRALC